MELSKNTLIKKLKYDFPLSALFVLATCYLVMGYESKLQRLFYFSMQSPLFEIFKTKFGEEYVLIWFSNQNRVIIPLFFWITATIFFIVGNLLQKNSINKSNLPSVLRSVFIFHLFLLLTKNTFTPYFWEFFLPGGYKPGLVIDNYQQIVSHIAITMYFGAGYLLILNYWSKNGLWTDLVPMLSILIPIWFGDRVEYHLSLCLLGIISFSIGKWLWEFNKKAFIDRNLEFPIMLAMIFLLGLFFRMKYAHFIFHTSNGFMNLSADAESYFYSAQNISQGNFLDVDYWRSPIYSYYLAALIKFMPKWEGILFYSQALVGALVPILIYSILDKIGFKKVGLIAAFLAASSQFCIHNSILINRAALQLISVPYLLYLTINYENKRTLTNFFLFGLALSLNLYLGTETIFIELLAIGYFIFGHIKNPTDQIKIKQFTYFFIGALIIIIPLNVVYHKHHEGWIPTGRDFSTSIQSEIWDSYINQDSSQKLKELGFLPKESLWNNIGILSQKPFKASKVIFNKFLIETKGFLWDVSPYFFAPLHLLEGSFFGANIEFYLYFFMAVGFFALIIKKEIRIENKILIVGSILLQTIGVGLLLYGIYRFRAPIALFNLIPTAFGLHYLLFSQKETSSSHASL